MLWFGDFSFLWGSKTNNGNNLCLTLIHSFPQTLAQIHEKASCPGWIPHWKGAEYFILFSISVYHKTSLALIAQQSLLQKSISDCSEEGREWCQKASLKCLEFHPKPNWVYRTFPFGSDFGSDPRKSAWGRMIRKERFRELEENSPALACATLDWDHC